MKLLYLLPVLVLGILLFGCAAQQQAPAAQGPTLPPTPTAAPTLAPTEEATPTPEATATPQPTLQPGGGFVPETTPIPGEIFSTPTVTPTPTPGPEIQEVHINASEFKFEPNTITLRKGVIARLVVQSLDQYHSIAVTMVNGKPDWAFNRPLERPGWNAATGRYDIYKPVTIEFTPYETGEWSFTSPLSLGSGATMMRGIIRVTD
ncbi:MAG: hypothetical protein AB1626_00265 [Candidatus Micrarchaeota archaeon]